MADSVFIIGSDTSFRPALMLGQGFPKEINGQPCFYYWKEVLPLGEYLDQKKRKFIVDDKRRDVLISCMRRASQHGYQPHLPTNHDSRDGKDNLGFIVDARANERGSLELLHQVIGEDANKIVARNKSSICTVKDFVDEKGNRYEELIDHNAIIPDPRISGLGGFKPALAAARGASDDAVVLELAASQEKEQTMPLDFSKLRKRLGAADTVPDDQLLTLADNRLAELDQQKTAAEAAKTEAEGKATAAEGRITELSRSRVQMPDENTLSLVMDSVESARDQAVRSGGISKATADRISALFLHNGKPTELALSRAGNSTRPIVKDIFTIMADNKPVEMGERTNIQRLNRDLPDNQPNPDGDPNAANDEKQYKEAFAQGEAEKKRRLEASGQR